MRTGDAVRDGLGNTYQIGQQLGRGLFGKSFVVRRESSDTLHVLKCPLTAEDFRGEVPGADAVFAASREAVLELARLYEQGQYPFLPRLETRFTLPDGLPAIVMPRLGDSLERRIAEGLPIGALVDALLLACRHARALGGGPGQHGNLRPSNIIFSDRGEVFLTDPAPPAVRRNMARLVGASPELRGWLPSEVANGTVEAGPGADGWGVAAMLWRGILGPEAPIERLLAGLDKAQGVTIKDRVLERMKAEDSNPRFHGRLAERLAVLLSRALSRETAPSPPYRFNRVDELQARLEEVAALIRPHVNQVGKVLFDRPPARPWFDTGADVAFSCAVGASVPVEGHEEIGVGIAVFDRERDQRLKDLELGYTCDRQPNGRYKFSFRVGGMVPGAYRARIAFAIRDSGQPPATAEGDFEVRATAGWVPPADAPTVSPLAFVRETTGVTAAATLAPPPPPEPAPSKPLPPPISAVDVPNPTLAPVPELVRLATGPVVEAHERRAAEAASERPAPVPVPVARPTVPPPEEPPVRAPKDWTYEPLPRPARPAAPTADEDLEPDEPEEPGPLARAWNAVRGDPYVLVMSGLGAIILVLILTFFAMRS
jgi:hypothetical protein